MAIAVLTDACGETRAKDFLESPARDRDNNNAGWQLGLNRPTVGYLVVNHGRMAAGLRPESGGHAGPLDVVFRRRRTVVTDSDYGASPCYERIEAHFSRWTGNSLPDAGTTTGFWPPTSDPTISSGVYEDSDAQTIWREIKSNGLGHTQTIDLIVDEPYSFSEAMADFAVLWNAKIDGFRADPGNSAYWPTFCYAEDGSITGAAVGWNTRVLVLPVNGGGVRYGGAGSAGLSAQAIAYRTFTTPIVNGITFDSTITKYFFGTDGQSTGTEVLPRVVVNTGQNELLFLQPDSITEFSEKGVLTTVRHFPPP